MTHIDTQYPESMKIQGHTQQSEPKCEVVYETCPRIELTLLRVHPAKSQDSPEHRFKAKRRLAQVTSSQRQVPRRGGVLVSSV